MMIEFGLTGGIGSGKSTVARMLVARGAMLIDADAMVRDLQRPGELVFGAMVSRWGDRIVKADGTLDRAAVADIVFNDDDELAALNDIVHPAVAEETERRLAEVRHTDAIVVHDIPLLVLPGGELISTRDIDSWGGIVVVDAPVDLAVERVVESRGMARDEVEARVSNQASRDDRRSVAGFVIDNSGDLDDLDAEVETCWGWMNERRAVLKVPT